MDTEQVIINYYIGTFFNIIQYWTKINKLMLTFSVYFKIFMYRVAVRSKQITVNADLTCLLLSVKILILGGMSLKSFVRKEYIDI